MSTSVRSRPSHARAVDPGGDRPRPVSVIDCDIHPFIEGGLKAVFPYMSIDWQQRLDSMKSKELLTLPVGRGTHWGTDRRDAATPSGGMPGSDPAFMLSHYIRPHNVDIAILLGIQASRVDTMTVAEDAATIAAAYNDYLADVWLPTFKGFRMAMVVAPQDPILAANEIKRFGMRPGVVGVWVPLINVLLGNRYFNPIFKAAADLGLPIVIHTNGSQGDFQGSPVYAGGFPSSKAERHSLQSELGMSTLASLIFEGVLERFQTLNFVFTETGWTWLAPLLWRMDASWKSGRRLVPWVKRPPSEYVVERIKFTTQPALEVPNDKYLKQICEMISAEKTLVFSSDYPHWDADEPEFPFRTFDDDFQARILRQNAIAAYGPRLLEANSK